MLGGRYQRWSPWITVFAVGYLIVSLARAQSIARAQGQTKTPDYSELYNARLETEYLKQRLAKIDDLHLERLQQQVEDMKGEMAYQRTVQNGVAVAVLANLLLAGLDWRKRRG